MASLSLSHINKRFAATEVLSDVNLEVADGEFVVLVGPSGCGKTTLLRMIAGLEEISSGDFRIGEERANDLPPQRRGIAMVFQSYALYPHLDVWNNIAFGPQLRGEARSSFEPRIRQVAEMLNLSPLLDRLPRALSGGQRQRVAMGRAVVRDPRLFLFDEPLSNLDAKLRVRMRAEIKALHQRLRTTVVYVTHDQIEAMTLADRIVLMNRGHIEQEGAPTALYDRPANTFVAGFLGSPSMNFLTGQYRDGALHTAAGAKLPCPPLPVEPGHGIILGVRPEDLHLAPDGEVDMQVDITENTGSETLLHGHIGDTTLCALERHRTVVRPGESIKLKLLLPRVHVFDAATTQRIEPRKA